MTYLIGFLVGFISCFGLMYWVGHKQQKKKEQALKGFNDSMTALNVTLSSIFRQHLLESQLKEALDREDYNEAARIRDLINKK